jgi:hypothetical protein
VVKKGLVECDDAALGKRDRKVTVGRKPVLVPGRPKSGGGTPISEGSHKRPLVAARKGLPVGIAGSLREEVLEVQLEGLGAAVKIEADRSHGIGGPDPVDAAGTRDGGCNLLWGLRPRIADAVAGKKKDVGPLEGIEHPLEIPKRVAPGCGGDLELRQFLRGARPRMDRQGECPVEVGVHAHADTLFAVVTRGAVVAGKLLRDDSFFQVRKTVEVGDPPK